MADCSPIPELCRYGISSLDFGLSFPELGPFFPSNWSKRDTGRVGIEGRAIGAGPPARLHFNSACPPSPHNSRRSPSQRCAPPVFAVSSYSRRGSCISTTANAGDNDRHYFRESRRSSKQRTAGGVGQFDCGRITGLNRATTGAYSRDVRAATNFRGAEKSRVWLGGRYSVARWRNGSSQGFHYRA